jgi:hypothetical protein
VKLVGIFRNFPGKECHNEQQQNRNTRGGSPLWICCEFDFVSFWVKDPEGKEKSARDPLRRRPRP